MTTTTPITNRITSIQMMIFQPVPIFLSTFYGVSFFYAAINLAFASMYSRVQFASVMFTLSEFRMNLRSRFFMNDLPRTNPDLELLEIKNKKIHTKHEIKNPKIKN